MLFENLEDIEIPSCISGKVAVKLHMGERGNKTHVSREEVDLVLDKIRENNGIPFLVDSLTLYPNARYTVEGYEAVARENGFEGLHLEIASNEDITLINGIPVINPVLGADSLLVLSHGKGHAATGFGGAIKNLGMGCTSREGKKWMHFPAFPKYDRKLCAHCGACADSCPFGFIGFDSTKKIPAFDLSDCCGCGSCTDSCPAKALYKEREANEEVMDRICRGAHAVTEYFLKNRGNRVFYVMVLKRITESCDCVAESEIIAPDIGFLSASNPLEIDEEAVSLLKEKSPAAALEWGAWELFKKVAAKYF
ncbi:DUF362 domain-containing protein [Candidatus Micrarchaeota archaeon]|nr:DUF362 domain-containing protein [Candidatus Micrarchaeota archaeon]